MSDGGLLVVDHSDKFVQGDKIAMRLEVSRVHTTLAFSKNGFGVAFDIP